MTGLIEIHGRAAFVANVTMIDRATGGLVDLSEKKLYFELEGAAHRTELGYDEDGTATVRTIYFDRDAVALLPTETTPFLIIDETIEGAESIVGVGKLKRVGWLS